MYATNLTKSSIGANIKGVEVNIGKRLFIYDLQSDELHSVVSVEGYSNVHNCVYGRVERGDSIGTPMQGVPGDGAVCLIPSDLEGYEVICAVG